MNESNRIIPWGIDQQKLQKLFFKDLYIRENQKDFFLNQAEIVSEEMNSPKNLKKIDHK